MLIGSHAYAFNEDGYSSGMSIEELRAAVSGKGYQFLLKEDQGTAFGGIKGSDNKVIDIGPVFTLCGNKMVNYSHNLDFDKDFTVQLDTILRTYGQPTKTEVKRMPVYGKANTFVTHVSMIWYTKGDRISLSFAPEHRDGHGDLQFYRQASIGFAAKNSCWSVSAW